MNSRSALKVRVTLLVLAAVVVVSALILEGRVASYKMDTVNSASDVQHLVDRGWLPAWFPASAQNVGVSQTTFDSSFVLVEFESPEIENILKNCSELTNAREAIPPSDFMKKFSQATRESFQQFLVAGPRVFECPDRGKVFYLGVRSASPKSYLWLPDW